MEDTKPRKHSSHPLGAAGRPLQPSTIRARASRCVNLAIDALSHVAADKTAPACDRVRAAEILLNHATMQQVA